MDERAQHWMELSAYDLDTAEAMMRTGRYLYVGFMCHQSIEKALKAHYQQYRREIPPRTHNLLVLASATGLLARMTDEQTDLLTELEPLAVEARYPEHKERLCQLLDQPMSASLLARSEEMRRWIQHELSK